MRQNRWLDVIRSLAVTLVFLRHGARALQTSGETSIGLWHNLALNGWIGVDLFFVLSGFLITQRWQMNSKSVPAWTHYKRYLRDRVLRIVPAYYVVVLLIVWGVFPFYEIEARNLDSSLIQHLLFLQDYTGANLNVAFWSLGVEAKFYLLAPLVVTRLRGSSWRRLLMALILVAGLDAWLKFQIFHHVDVWTYPSFFRALRSPFNFNFFPLLLGMVIALLHEGKSGVIANPRLWFRIGLVILGLGLVSHDFLAELNWWDASLVPFFFAVVAGVLIFAATERQDEPPFSRGWTVLSRISYSLFLVHYSVIPLSQRLAGESALGFWLLYAALSFTIAGVLYFAVERPFLWLKSRRMSPNAAAR
jgi:peptidoglycan/LPS O-acetylase OafA/YrhL